MRGVGRVLVGVLFGVGVLVAPAVAGAGTPQPVTLNVTKVVTGGVPAGTTFEVQVDCDTGTDSGAEGGPTTQTLTFEEDGGTQSIELPQFQPVCTITETEDGGAEVVSYSSADPSDDFCEFGASTESITVTYSRAEVCSVSIGNEFPDIVAPPPAEPPPPAVDPADVVQAQPSFTG